MISEWYSGGELPPETINTTGRELILPESIEASGIVVIPPMRSPCTSRAKRVTIHISLERSDPGVSLLWGRILFCAVCNRSYEIMVYLRTVFAR